MSSKTKKCPAILKSGQREGKKCDNAVKTGKYCGKHTKSKTKSKSPKARKSKRSKTPVKSKKTDQYSLRNYFDKIYIVNLEDKKEAYDEVSEQLNKHNIPHERFLAIDGRGTPEVKEQKRKMFEKEYGLKIGLEKDGKVNMPAISLTIGNILMMREMVKNNWKRMLILEDDVILDENIMDDFQAGVKELEKAGIDWDLLYLSCGGQCGRHGVSYNKTAKNKYLTSWTQHHSWAVDLEEDYGQAYVYHPYDIRLPCSLKDCPKVSKHITELTGGFGGTFAYSISLHGAKKFLKFVNDKVGGRNDKRAHIDQLLKLAVEKGILSAFAFDPVLIFHKYGVGPPPTGGGGAGRRSIEW